MRLGAMSLALGLSAAAPLAAALAAEEIEFVFIGDRAVSLTQPGAEVSLRDRFGGAALRAKLPGYNVDFVDEIEGADAFEVSRGLSRFLHIRGDLATGRIINIIDYEGVADATGAVPYQPLPVAYSANLAECTLSPLYLTHVCRSEHSPVIWYVVTLDDDCPAEFHDFAATGQRTALIDCMIIAGLEIGQP